MSKLPHRYWSTMTSQQFAQLDAEQVIAVLPVGAIEQHGPHLPVSVDSCIIDGIVNRALGLMADDLPVTILPTMTVGKSNEHDRYPGTLTLSADTLIRLWMDIGASVAAAGVRKLVLFNSHGGQISVMDIVARDLRIQHNMIVVASNWFALGLPEGMFSDHELKHGIHGGELETSLMLALAPEQVDMSEARHFTSLTEDLARENKLLSLAPGGKLAWQIQDLNPLGACGDAALASAEKGQQVLDFVAQGFVELLQEINRLPLSVLNKPPAW